MSRKRKIDEPSDATANLEETFTSEPINDRSSTFIGRFSPAGSAKALQASPDFRDASHRIAAWRRPSAQRILAPNSQTRRQLYDSGHDDDGEKYAGKRLEKLLEDMKIEGSVVVARWYGGILLGPVRFTHIEDCAREAILRSRGSGNLLHAEKRQKVQEEDDADRKANLEELLQQRDQSIVVLRALLTEKSAAKDGTGVTPTTPAKQIDYSKMPLVALNKLEKARDATISWLLEQISKAEAAVEAAPSEGKPYSAVASTELEDEQNDGQTSTERRSIKSGE